MPIDLTLAQKLCSQTTGMSPEETVSVLKLLVSERPSVEEGAALLNTWAARGETGTELASAVRFLRKAAVKVPTQKPCFDLCGTGGSGLTRYNISTTVAFVVAAAGVPVAKHGNKGSRRPNGSFDLLESLDVPFLLPPEAEAKLQSESGLCFLFARSHHPIVGKVVPYRKAAGCRSIFNLAGPLANPAPIQHQLIGTINEKTARIMASALKELKTEGALIVWGEPGIDEISITGKTGFLKVSPRGVSSGFFSAPSFPELDYSELPGGDAEVNAQIFLRLLGGEETGPLLEMLCVSAGAALDLWRGEAPSYAGPGYKEARSLIDEGKALRTFEEHRSLARALTAS